ncbi:MAG: heavy metal translocating P-type ATPase [Ignavibacteria bacterium]|nr:heavy metal translocating P-type ATPase [Ignavibacteria bacterium]
MRSDNQELEKSFQISGVDCPVCADEVKKELLKLDGIISAKVEIDESKVLLKLKPESFSEKEVERTISELGLQIQKEGSRKTSVFYVEGMDCSNEERVIREALKSIKEIDEIKFDLMNQRLIVTHRTAEGKIIKAIKEIGFKAEVYHNKLHQKSRAKKKSYIQLLLLIFTSLLVIVGFAGEYLHLHQNFIIALFILGAILGGYKVFQKAFLSLRKLIIDSNVLMTIAVFGAMAIGKFAEAAVVMLLYAISLKLESYSIEKAKKSINKLIALIPEFSTIKKGDEFIQIPTTEVRVGDILLIKPGEKIPVDGIVLEGASVVNQSAITGESKLISKIKGDTCYAGTINLRGTLLIEATSTYKNSHFSKILSLLEETTSNSKSNLQKVVDVFAKYYTPIVVFLAFIITGYSYFLAKEDFYSSIYRGLVLLVISCPCALVISTPVAILSALARSTKYGALIKGGIFLENLHRVDAIAFDKTGTLTEGAMKIDKIIPFNGLSAEELLEIAYNLEINSEHSIADAIIDYAKNQDIQIEKVENFKVEDGAISGIFRNKKYVIGQPKLFINYLNDEQKNLIQSLENSGSTVIIILEETTPLGIIALIDSVRESMKNVLQELKAEGVKDFFILSGDNKSIVEKVAKDLGFEKYYAELKPIDKLNLIKELNTKYNFLAMVGDGLNDAPALKSASIGIAMGKIGTDATIENSDITLIGDEISKLPKLFRLSRKTVNTIKENIFLSIAIKTVFILLTFIGIASMWGAIFADMGSALIVIFNSLKLTKTKI